MYICISRGVCSCHSSLLVSSFRLRTWLSVRSQLTYVSLYSNMLIYSSITTTIVSILMPTLRVFLIASNIVCSLSVIAVMFL
jgi:hypothetical protein